MYHEECRKRFNFAWLPIPTPADCAKWEEAVTGARLLAKDVGNMLDTARAADDVSMSVRRHELSAVSHMHGLLTQALAALDAPKEQGNANS